MIVSLIGAGGKMGGRITDHLIKSQYKALYVETDKKKLEDLTARGLQATPLVKAVKEADIVILAIPDIVIERISHEIVPQMKSGGMLMVLDAAAAFGGELPERSDLSFFITHPCHPPIISDETDPEVRKEWHGGIRARQSIVCALMQGTEEDYKKGEALAQTIFAPIMRTHRLTVEQMAILEPAMAETIQFTFMVTIKEAMEEAIKAGVPEQAATDFMLGHLNSSIWVLFGNIGDYRELVSDGALKTLEMARSELIRPDWKKVFKLDNILKQVKGITKWE
ncbi:MAG: NAD(P)-binding domain-containing protein [Spirochaetota bacterium]|nr:MAG: NAD(P)-binding domain-containing protein [Spirochaetota bacterium]